MSDGEVIEAEALGSARKSDPEVRGKVLTGPERRRRWSVEEKLRILAQSVAPGASAMLGMSASRNQQRPALYVAQAVPHGRADRVRAGHGRAGGNGEPAGA